MDETLLIFGALLMFGSIPMLRHELYILGSICAVASTIMQCVGAQLHGYSWAAGMAMAGLILAGGSLSIQRLVDGEWVDVEPAFIIGVVIGIIMLILGGYLAYS